MTKGSFQLILQSLNLVVGFMVWVIISALMPFIKSDISIDPSQLALVTAVPVILGSILRIPLGYWTNRFGARILFFISFLVLLIPIYFISIAHSVRDLILGGLALGIGGAIFSVGVTSLPKYYPKERHGFVNGIYGAGNIGTAITTFTSPILATSLGWRTTVRLYLILLIVFALLTFLLGDRHEQKVTTSLTQQIKGVYKNYKLWFLCLFYFITFGSFVAFTVYLPSFLVNHFELEKVDAGLRTAGFIALATLFRPVGGWLGDKLNPFILLMFVFTGLSFASFLLSFTPSLNIYTVGCLLVALCAGIGNGTIFKLVPLYFSKQAGIVNGIVSAMGGIGGFFPPLVLTTLFNLTGHYAIGFMALSEFSIASLIIVIGLYYQDKLTISERIVEGTVEGIMLTDTNGIIQKVNPAFTAVTGYTSDEIVGKNPTILQSGKHDTSFYNQMWDDIKTNGHWQGEIWNKRKNNEVYLELLTISAITDDNGNVKNYVGMFNDITSKK